MRSIVPYKLVYRFAINDLCFSTARWGHRALQMRETNLQIKQPQRWENSLPLRLFLFFLYSIIKVFSPKPFFKKGWKIPP